MQESNPKNINTLEERQRELLRVFREKARELYENEYCTPIDVIYEEVVRADKIKQDPNYNDSFSVSDAPRDGLKIIEEGKEAGSVTWKYRDISMQGYIGGGSFGTYANPETARYPKEVMEKIYQKISDSKIFDSFWTKLDILWDAAHGTTTTIKKDERGMDRITRIHHGI